jgi:hypothetical protein
MGLKNIFSISKNINWMIYSFNLFIEYSKGKLKDYKKS